MKDFQVILSVKDDATRIELYEFRVKARQVRCDGVAIRKAFGACKAHICRQRRQQICAKYGLTAKQLSRMVDDRLISLTNDFVVEVKDVYELNHMVKPIDTMWYWDGF